MSFDQPPQNSLTKAENTTRSFNFLLEHKDNFYGKQLRVWNEATKQDHDPEVIEEMRIDSNNNLVITTAGGNEHSLNPVGGINAATDFFKYKNEETGAVYVVSKED
jgi:hypothetical protein